MLLNELIERSQSYPELLHLDHKKITLYIALVRHLKLQISYTQLSTCTGVPLALPRSIHNFLKLAVDLDDHNAHIWPL